MQWCNNISKQKNIVVINESLWSVSDDFSQYFCKRCEVSLPVINLVHPPLGLNISQQAAGRHWWTQETSQETSAELLCLSRAVCSWVCLSPVNLSVPSFVMLPSCCPDSSSFSSAVTNLHSLSTSLFFCWHPVSSSSVDPPLPHPNPPWLFSRHCLPSFDLPTVSVSLSSFLPPPMRCPFGDKAKGAWFSEDFAVGEWDRSMCGWAAWRHGGWW